MANWYDLTPKEREEYVNQDYVTMRHIYVDVDTFDADKYNIGSVYKEVCVEDYNLENVFEKLSRRQGEVIRLLFIEGLAQKSAAKRMGISRNSVKTHLARAKKKLRVAFPPKYED
jgi:DNA-directed RNA polymerase specialized sigma24 family protein